MARSKVTRHPVSGAPGVAQKRSAGAQALNPLTFESGGANYLDVTVAANEYRANHPVMQFVGKQLTPLPQL